MSIGHLRNLKRLKNCFEKSFSVPEKLNFKFYKAPWFLQKIQQRHSDDEQPDDTNRELNRIEAVDLANTIFDDLGSMLPPLDTKEGDSAYQSKNG